MLNKLGSRKFADNINFSYQEDRLLEKTLANTISKNEAVRASFFYFNDLHGKIGPLESLTNDIELFRNRTKEKDQFIVASGDVKIGNSEKLNTLILLWMELIKLDLIALGNHELDCGVLRFANQLDNLNSLSKQYLGREAGYKFLAANMNCSSASPLASHIYNDVDVIFDRSSQKTNKKIVRSCIIEKNGHKYAFIGIIPNKFESKVSPVEYIFHKDELLGKISRIDTRLDGEITSGDLKDTIKIINEEIKKIKQKDSSINKIILLSHSSLFNDVTIAKNTKDIDIIIGGHSHHEKPGFFVNSLNNEPVLITQAGRNGIKYGTIDAIFNSNGIIDKDQTLSLLINTKLNAKNDNVAVLKDEILGPVIDLGTLKNSFKLPVAKRIYAENDLLSFICDAVKYVDTKISLFKGEKPADCVLMVNNFDFLNGKFSQGKISNRDILHLSPFKNNLFKVELTGQEVKDIINWGINSFDKKNIKIGLEDPKPGFVNVSGLRYSVDYSLSNKLVDLFLLDLEGNIISKLDPSKKYNVIFDDYLIRSARYSKNMPLYGMLNGKALRPLIWDKINEYYTEKKEKGATKESAMMLYIRSFKNQPFNINRDPLGTSQELSRIEVKNLDQFLSNKLISFSKLA